MRTRYNQMTSINAVPSDRLKYLFNTFQHKIMTVSKNDRQVILDFTSQSIERTALSALRGGDSGPKRVGYDLEKGKKV